MRGKGLAVVVLLAAGCAQGVDSDPPPQWSTTAGSRPDIDVEEEDTDAGSESGESGGSSGGKVTFGSDGFTSTTGADPGDGSSGGLDSAADSDAAMTSGASMTGPAGTSGMGESGGSDGGGSGGGPMGNPCPQDGWVPCGDGSGICIPPFWLCDNFNDCPSGNDESAMFCP